MSNITYYTKKKIEGIGEIMAKKAIKPVKKVCAYEWQDRAFMIAEKLGIDFIKNKKHLGEWLRLFKNGDTLKLDKCYSFLVDYNRPLEREAKIKMFYWRYYHDLTEFKGN